MCLLICRKLVKRCPLILSDFCNLIGMPTPQKSKNGGGWRMRNLFMILAMISALVMIAGLYVYTHSTAGQQFLQSTNAAMSPTTTTTTTTITTASIDHGNGMFSSATGGIKGVDLSSYNEAVRKAESITAKYQKLLLQSTHNEAELTLAKESIRRVDEYMHHNDAPQGAKDTVTKIKQQIDHLHAQKVKGSAIVGANGHGVLHLESPGGSIKNPEGGHSHTGPLLLSSSTTTSSMASSTTNKNAKDVVIGMAYDIDPKNLAVFCASLREVNTKADVLMFAKEPIPPLYTEIAVKNKIELIPFSIDKFQKAYQGFHASTLRWLLIIQYFEQNSVRKDHYYKKVWLADARDTYFQKDPFTMLKDGDKGFYAFKGVENLLVKDCGWNGGWIKDCFGNKMIDTMGKNNIICSGVSMGDWNSVYTYLSLMKDIISKRERGSALSITDHMQFAGFDEPAMRRRYKEVYISSRFPTCERNGVDQGVHNVLVHNQVIPNLHIYTHKDGPVANLQAGLSNIDRNTGRVTNGVGESVAVVHQYDRKPDLQKKLFHRYVYWVDTNDPQAEWNHEATCASYSKQENMDLFKGRCDLKMKGGATSAASCCKYCSETPHCQAFTFWSSVCFLKSCGMGGTKNRGQSLAGAVSGYMH